MFTHCRNKVGQDSFYKRLHWRFYIPLVFYSSSVISGNLCYLIEMGRFCMTPDPHGGWASSIILSLVCCPASAMKTGKTDHLSWTRFSLPLRRGNSKSAQRCWRIMAEQTCSTHQRRPTSMFMPTIRILISLTNERWPYEFKFKHPAMIFSPCVFFFFFNVTYAIKRSISERAESWISLVCNCKLCHDAEWKGRMSALYLLM